MSREEAVIDLLKSYSKYKIFLHSQEFAKKYFDKFGTHKIVKNDEYEEKMHVIESLIELLAPSDEYTLLHLHYIKGVTVEKSAECMCVSERTAYRILKKAHKAICDMVSEHERSRQ